MKKFKILNTLAIAAMAFLALACKSPENVAYFTNLKNGTVVQTENECVITIQPDDNITVFVKSRDPQLNQMFNLVMGSTQGYATDASLKRAYIVDSKGYIDFPALGKIQVAGKRREEVADYIKKQLVDQNQVKDPIVIVDFDNLYYSVTGEVNRPGRYAITKDHLTLLEALATAGDLTIQARRYNVLVMRKEGNNTVAYRVDLTNSSETMASPAYQIKQDDVIYVEPNDKRQRDTTVNGNNVLSASFWISIVSLAATLATLIFK